jgi:epoxyqueuosine reductase QueG
MREKIRNLIREFVGSYKTRNRTKTNWEAPLVAFARADDPLFLELRRVASKTHKLPSDLLRDAKTVVAYFIPFKKEISMGNAGGESCSEAWAQAYIETNKLIVDLNNFLSAELKKLNFSSCILPPTHNFDEKRLVSDWSHKHVAFIAGLGKFGLHQMLITEKGCCGRLGSLITNADMEPTKRPETEFCLYKYNKSCRKCVENCIFGALKASSFDRHGCYEICLSNAKTYSRLGLADVCGKCICIAPCSFKNPMS